MATATKAAPPDRDVMIRLMEDLQAVEAEIAQREAFGNPLSYGLPDLMFGRNEKPSVTQSAAILETEGVLGRVEGLTGPVVFREKLDHEETEEEWHLRQNAAVTNFVEKHLWVAKDAGRQRIAVIPQMTQFIADLFYQRTRRAILWKPRGGGGSLSAAILIFMYLVYRQTSVLDVAGAQEQAQVVYRYVKGFWDCVVPGTLIVTESGPRPIEEVEAGDRVLTEDGSFRVVLRHIVKSKAERVVRVVPVGWPEGMTVTKDHQIKTVDGWRRAGDLKKDDVLEFPVVKAEALPPQLVLTNTWTSEERHGAVERRSVHEDRLVISDVPAFARLLGYWLAEGCLGGGAYEVGFTFGPHEDDLVTDCQGLIKQLFGVEGYVDDAPTAKCVRFSSRTLVAWLKEQTRHGARNKRIPLWLLQGADRPVLVNLLKGLVRGDGWEGKSEVQFTSTSAELAQAVWLIMNRLGVLAGFSRGETRPSEIDGRAIVGGRPVYHVKVAGEFARDLLRAFDAPVDDPSRSWNRIRRDGDRFLVPVASTEELDYAGEVHDLTVEGVHSFCTLNGVMHNCVPAMKQRLLTRPPTVTETHLLTGCMLKAVPATEKQGRGKHFPVLFADESCSSDESSDRSLRSAMSGVTSEENNVVVLLSTFHVPSGLFQEYWDFAAEKGFTRYKWNAFDCCMPWTRVLTSAGYTQIKDVKIGDRVLGADGRWDVVERVWSKKSSKKKLCIEVEGFQQEGVGVTEDHRVYALVGAEVWKNDNGRYREAFVGREGRDRCAEVGTLGWVRAGDLKRGDFVAIPRPKKTGVLNLRPIPVTDGNRWGSWTVSEIAPFEDLRFWRFVGYFLGDGHAEIGKSRVYVSFNVRDRDWIADVRNMVRDLFGRECDEVPAGKRGIALRFSFAGLNRWLREMFYDADRKKRIGVEVLSALTDDQVRQLLAGLVRSDGSTRGATARTLIRWGTTSKSLEACMVYCLLRVGVAPGIYFGKRDATHVSWMKRETPWVDGCGPGVSRECPTDFHDEGFVFVPVRDVREIDEGDDVWDVTVSGGHAFVAGLTLAHNTMAACKVGLETATEEDPRALKHCETCPLSWWIDERGMKGEVVSRRLGGCAGQARTSKGWETFGMVMDARRLHLGTNVFEIEFCCFVPGTWVITENGFEKIEEIEPGTKVLTHRGRWRPAWPMRRQYKGRLVRLSGQGGPPILMTPEHPVFHQHGEKTGWIEARHFLNKRYATYLPATSEQLEPALVELLCPVGGPGEREPRRQLVRGPKFFEFLGCVLGDGYVEFRDGEPKYVGLSGIDNPELFEEYGRTIREVFDRKVNERGEHETLGVFGHRALAEWLVENTGRYCHEKGLPPDLFLSMSSEEDAAFLRGYLETDGCKGEETVRFCSTSPSLAGQAYAILLRNGIAVSMHCVRPTTKIFPNGKEYDCREAFVVTVSGPSRDSLLALLTGVRSTRPESTPHIRREGPWMVYPRRNAEEVEYDGEVFNLEVDDDDQSYCLPAMAVHNCQRPNWMRTVYDPELVDLTAIEEMDIEPTDPKCVGIDWGYETAGSMAIVLASKGAEYVGVPEAILTDHVLVGEVKRILGEWREMYGAFIVYADKSHPFENAELAAGGFAVEVVDYGQLKNMGIQNVQKYLTSRRLKILDEFRVGREQMKSLRRTERGSIVKKSEHFCDALLNALLYFRFDEWWPLDMGVESPREEVPKVEPVRGAVMAESSSDGSVVLI